MDANKHPEEKKFQKNNNVSETNSRVLLTQQETFLQRDSLFSSCIEKTDRMSHSASCTNVPNVLSGHSLGEPFSLPQKTTASANLTQETSDCATISAPSSHLNIATMQCSNRLKRVVAAAAAPNVADSASSIISASQRMCPTNYKKGELVREKSFSASALDDVLPALPRPNSAGKVLDSRRVDEILELQQRKLDNQKFAILRRRQELALLLQRHQQKRAFLQHQQQEQQKNFYENELQQKQLQQQRQQQKQLQQIQQKQLQQQLEQQQQKKTQREIATITKVTEQNGQIDQKCVATPNFREMLNNMLERKRKAINAGIHTFEDGKLNVNMKDALALNNPGAKRANTLDDINVLKKVNPQSKQRDGLYNEDNDMNWARKGGNSDPGNFVALALDPKGCRYLQHLLDEQHHPGLCDQIVQSTLDIFPEMMVDPWANYLCQKIIEYASDEILEKIVTRVASSVLSIAVNVHGTRSLQKLVAAVTVFKVPVCDHNNISSKYFPGCSIEQQLRSFGTQNRADGLAWKTNANMTAPRPRELYNLLANNTQTGYNIQHRNQFDHQNFPQFRQQQQQQSLPAMYNRTARQRMIKMLQTELTPFIVTLSLHHNGNHVIRQCLENWAPIDNQFIAAALIARCLEIAKDRNGCCVMQRCLQNSTPLQRHLLATEIARNTPQLVMDAFGNYVVQCVLDICHPTYTNQYVNFHMHDPNMPCNAKCIEAIDLAKKCQGGHIEAIVRSVRGYLAGLSRQKFSSNVVEKCLRLAPDHLRKELMAEIYQLETLCLLLRDSYGNYVVQTSIDFATHDQRNLLVECVIPLIPLIQNTRYGRRILYKLKHSGSFTKLNMNEIAAPASVIPGVQPQYIHENQPQYHQYREQYRQDRDYPNQRQNRNCRPMI